MAMEDRDMRAPGVLYVLVRLSARRSHRTSQRKPLRLLGAVLGLGTSLLPGVGCTDGSEPGPRQPTGRYSAVGGLDVSGTWLYVVGGGSEEGILQDAWRLEVATGTWERLSDPPLPMLRGTASRDDDDDLLIFGGEGPGYDDMARLWRWSLEADDWEELTVDGPPVRKKHAAGWGDGALWVSGGEHNDSDPDVIRDDLWTWREAESFVEQDDAGGPGPAYRHGLAWEAAGERLWHHAGYDADDARTDRLWSREADGTWTEWHWTDGPPVRASHSFGIAPDGACGLEGPTPFAWGGHASDDALWCFDPETSTWTSVAPPGDAPLPRDAQVADLAPDGRTLVLACGDPVSEDVDDFVCDAWTLDLETGAWTVLVPVQ